MLYNLRDQRDLQLARCVYECNSIQNIIIVRELLFERGSRPVSVRGKMPFDYYLIGHCICHVGGQWSITVNSREEIARLIDGLASNQAIRGQILELTLLTGPLEKLNRQRLIKYAGIGCLKLHFVDFSESDVAILENYIKHKVLKKVVIGRSCKNVQLFNALFKPSSLDTVYLSGTPSVGNGTKSIADTIHRLLCENKNLKELLISDTIIDPELLTRIVLSNATLKELNFCVTGNSRQNIAVSSKRHSLERNAKPSLQTESPMSDLEEVAKQRNIKFKLTASYCDTSLLPSYPMAIIVLSRPIQFN